MSRQNKKNTSRKRSQTLEIDSDIYVVKHIIETPENPFSIIIFREMGSDNELIWLTDEPNDFEEDRVYRLKIQATGKYIVDLTLMQQKAKRAYVSA